MKSFKAELLKLRFHKIYWAFIGIAVFLSVLSGLGAAFATQNSNGTLPAGLLLNHNYVDGIYSKALAGYIFAIVGGVSLMTNEFRYNTATGTFLGQPRRIDVVKAKFAAGAIYGIIVMAISTALGLIAAYVGMLPYKHVAPDISSIATIIWSAILMGFLLGTMGVSLGTLIRNYQIATTGTMIYLYIVERLLVVFVPHFAKYLTTGLITSLMDLNLKLKIGNGIAQINTQDFLPVLPATLLLILYSLAIAGLAVRTTLRRDI